MEEKTKTAYDDLLIREAPGSVDLSAPGLAGLHPALASRVLRKGLHRVKQDLRRITHTHIKEILNLTPMEAKSLDLPGQIRVYKTRSKLQIKKEALPLRELGQKQKEDRLESRGD